MHTVQLRITDAFKKLVVLLLDWTGVDVERSTFSLLSHIVSVNRLIL